MSATVGGRLQESPGAKAPCGGLRLAATRNRLARAAVLLAERLGQLEDRLCAGDESAWPAYLDTARVLTAAVEHIEPGRAGELLTTQQMAERLNLSPKTLLKRKARGEIRPALQRGKLIRWRGDEGMR